MKKKIGILLSLLIISSSAFAGNFFTNRIAEIKINAPLNFSNNVFSLNDIFVKDLQIDLRKIAQKVPSEGLIFSSNAKPEFSLNLNLKRFWLGFDAGLDISGRFSTSKDLFDFLGYGNELGEELDISLYNNFDVYTYFDAKVGLDFTKCRLQLRPAFFTPVISMSGSLADFVFKNDEEGNLFIMLDQEMVIHSLFNMEESLSATDFMTLRSFGIDIGASVDIPIDEAKTLTISGRLPLVPGHVYNTAYISSKSVMDSTVVSAASADMEEESDTVYVSEDDYYVHRPLKLELYYNYAPLGSFFDLNLGLGFGIYHPFMENAKFYPEYYIGTDLSLARMVTLGVSTEYMDQVFKHEIGIDFSVRFVELGLGVSLQSPSFTKSFAATGFGAYFTFTAGF